MDDGTPTTAPHRRRWHQFSLREFLLATVAIGAILALVVSNRGRSPTAFFLSLDEGRLIRRVDGRHNIGLVTNSNALSVRNFSSPRNRSCRSTFAAPGHNTIQTVLMPQLYEEVEDMIHDAGCSVSQRRTEGTPRRGQGNALYDDLSAFSFHYKSGAVRGKILVLASEGPHGETHLRIETDEW